MTDKQQVCTMLLLNFGDRIIHWNEVHKYLRALGYEDYQKTLMMTSLIQDGILNTQLYDETCLTTKAIEFISKGE